MEGGNDDGPDPDDIFGLICTCNLSVVERRLVREGFDEILDRETELDEEGDDERFSMLAAIQRGRANVPTVGVWETEGDVMEGYAVDFLEVAYEDDQGLYLRAREDLPQDVPLIAMRGVLLPANPRLLDAHRRMEWDIANAFWGVTGTSWVLSQVERSFSNVVRYLDDGYQSVAVPNVEVRWEMTADEDWGPGLGIIRTLVPIKAGVQLLAR